MIPDWGAIYKMMASALQKCQDQTIKKTKDCLREIMETGRTIYYVRFWTKLFSYKNISIAKGKTLMKSED